MVATEILAQGVEQGIITAEQAQRLRALENVGEPPELPVSPDDEQLRFISGFSDVFVTIGLAMFLGAIGFFAAQIGGGLGAGIVIAATTWLLAEFFTRVRRMALPSIVLLIVFACAVFVAAGHAIDANSAGYLPRAPLDLFGPGNGRPTVVAGGAFVTVLLVALHYWRFRVPITIAAGCAALTGTVFSLFYGLVPDLPSVAYNAVIFVCGLAVFAFAMQFDMTDPERRTRRTDIAFWLHLLAAPLIVHSVTRGLVTEASKLELSHRCCHHRRVSGAEFCRRSDRPPRDAGVRSFLCRRGFLGVDPPGRPFRYDNPAHIPGAWCVRAVAKRRLAAAARWNSEYRAESAHPVPASDKSIRMIESLDRTTLSMVQNV